MTIYFISGLGADERVFQFLHLPRIEKKFIRWIDPQKNETLRSYTLRLIEQIEKKDELILVGISFGGLIAQEIASLIPCKKVLLISTVKSESEFSLPLRFIRFTRIDKLFSARFLKRSNKLTADFFFGTRSKQESRLLHQIIADTDEKFLRWAIDQIMAWRAPGLKTDFIHIHGTRDRIFPVNCIRDATLIQGGGHFMIVSQSDKVSNLVLRNV